MLIAGLAFATAASAADRIRIVAQKTGTLAWELDVIKTRGLDKAADLDIQVVEFASTEAGRIALASGSADMIVSDWLWVSRERSLGSNLVFYPYSSTLGCVIAPATSEIADTADLKGKKLAIAGGPLDKNWLMLQAVARRANLDLKKEAKVVFGAPPLLSEKALQGEHEATLTFWNFCADLEGKGMKRVIDMEAIEKQLGASGPVAMLGYAFDGGWAAKNKAAVARFLKIAADGQGDSREARNPSGSGSPRASASPTRPGSKSTASATARAFPAAASPTRRAIPARSMACSPSSAGTNLVGTAKELDKGTFYDPGKAD